LLETDRVERSRPHQQRLLDDQNENGRHDIVIGAVGLSLSVLHGMEFAICAAAYLRVGALDTPMKAMFYSIDSMTTRGGAELVLPPHWQMMGALEAANGMILFGIITAFLFAMMQVSPPRA
jgi:hypothetical protein